MTYEVHQLRSQAEKALGGHATLAWLWPNLRSIAAIESSPPMEQAVCLGYDSRSDVLQRLNTQLRQRAPKQWMIPLPFDGAPQLHKAVKPTAFSIDVAIVNLDAMPRPAYVASSVRFGQELAPVCLIYTGESGLEEPSSCGGHRWYHDSGLGWVVTFRSEITYKDALTWMPSNS